MYTMIYQVIKNKKGGGIRMNGSYRIVSVLYIRKGILEVRTYCIITGKSLSKDMEYS